jgi:hypothetical protein
MNLAVQRTYPVFYAHVKMAMNMKRSTTVYKGFELTLESFFNSFITKTA